MQAVRGVNLSVEQGRITALLGANGAGKTTTVKIAAGLILKDRGRVSFPALGAHPTLGAVLEGSRNLYWRLSPWENIRYFGELKGVPLSLLRRQAGELLEAFGLADRRDRPAQQLSRGMQQKLAVVLALLGDPRLLLLDEPTLGLDVESGRTIQDMLRRLCTERGITILVTTHQMDLAQALCDSIAIMRQGTVAIHQPLGKLIGLFKRHDYLVTLSAADWEAARGAFDGWTHSIEESPSAQQVTIRFMLRQGRDVYQLVALLQAVQADLIDLRQSEPTLEEIFVAVSRGGLPVAIEASP